MSFNDRAQRRRSLERRLSPAAMKRVSRKPELLSMKAKRRTMTFLVCRIRRFAEIADAFADDPEGLTRLTRKAMTPLVQTVLDRGGALDRIMPGGLSAFFNAPLDDPQHAIHACQCALSMIQTVEKVSRTLESTLRPDGTPLGPIGIGIGINTGEGVIGDFGSEGRTAYSVAGAAASFTSKLERLSAHYGTAILVGGSTQAMAEKNFAFLEVDMLSQPKTDPLALFALLGSPVSRANPKFLALKTFHERIFTAYRAREWDIARGLIGQARALSNANQVIYELYLKRITYYESHPPGPNWNGVFA
jgi:adenylate cyclase